MAIKSVVYSRGFIAKQYTRMCSRVFYISKEDCEFREKLHSKFDSKGLDYLNLKGKGFDGKIIYNFKIMGDSQEEGKYTTKVSVRKMGDESVIEKEYSDFEKFLIANDFKLEKD